MSSTSFTYLLTLSIVVNLFNIALGATSSYFFDKLVENDKRKPVHRRRLVNFSFGVVFTMIVFKLGIMKIQKSIVEATNSVISRG